MSDKDPKWIKKAFTVTWLLLFLLLGLFVWSILKDKPTQVNNNYTAQKPESAYDIAVKNGFKGTEKMWLESLRAEPSPPVEPPKDGKDGRDGRDGKDSVSTHTEGQTVLKEKVIVQKPIKGEKGENGRTMQLAQDSASNKLFYRYEGDDDWQPLPLLCLGIICKGE